MAHTQHALLLAIGTYAPPVVRFISFRFSFVYSFVSHCIRRLVLVLVLIPVLYSFRTRPRSHSRPRSFVSVLVRVCVFASSRMSPSHIPCYCQSVRNPFATHSHRIASPPLPSFHSPSLSFFFLSSYIPSHDAALTSLRSPSRVSRTIVHHAMYRLPTTTTTTTAAGTFNAIFFFFFFGIVVLRLVCVCVCIAFVFVFVLVRLVCVRFCVWRCFRSSSSSLPPLPSSSLRPRSSCVRLSSVFALLTFVFVRLSSVFAFLVLISRSIFVPIFVPLSPHPHPLPRSIVSFSRLSSPLPLPLPFLVSFRFISFAFRFSAPNPFRSHFHNATNVDNVENIEGLRG